jgi:hypothetical protein
VLIDRLEKTLGCRVEKRAEGDVLCRWRDVPDTDYRDQAAFRAGKPVAEQPAGRFDGVERVLAESGKRRDVRLAAYLYALMTARSQTFMEAWDIKKQKVTFEQLMTKISEDLGLPEQWHQEGVWQSKLETARRMKADGLDIGAICKYSDLSPADIATL